MAVQSQKRLKEPQHCQSKALRTRWDSSVMKFVGWPPIVHLDEAGAPPGQPGSVDARPNHWPGRGQGLCQREFVAQSGIKAKGRGAERTRPVKMRALRPRRDDQRGFARKPLRIRPDESLLFQSDTVSSAGRDYMDSTNKLTL